MLLADALGELLQQARAWPTPALEVDWPTFAGNVRRDAIAAAIQDVSLTPAWKRPLDPPGDYQGAAVRRWDAPEIRVAETDQQLCSYHPVIVGSSVLVVTRERLCCWDLATGRAVSWSGNDAGQIYPTAPADSSASAARSWRGLHVPRFSLTVSGSHVFFLMPVAAAERPAPSEHDPPENRLIGLDLAAQGKLLFTPVAPPDRGWFFDGVRLWTAMTSMCASGNKPLCRLCMWPVCVAADGNGCDVWDTGTRWPPKRRLAGHTIC